MSFTAKPQDPFYVVSVNDEALEKNTFAGKVALRKYVGERDPSVLVFKPGGRPAKFHCRPLSNAARQQCEAIDQEVLRHALAFAACLDRVEDLGVPWSPTRTLAPWSPQAQMLDGECVDALAEAIGGKVIEEVGSVCLQRANLTALQGKAYRLPLGYVVVWPSANAQTTPTSAAEDSTRH